MDDLEKLYTFEEVGQYLNLKKKTLLVLLRDGTLPATKIGVNWRIKAVDLKEYVKNLPIRKKR